MNAADLPDDGTSTPEAMELRRQLAEAQGTLETLRGDLRRRAQEANEWAEKAGRLAGQLALERAHNARAVLWRRWLWKVWRAVGRR